MVAKNARLRRGKTSMEGTAMATPTLGKKGDVNRYILYLVILMILLILILVLFFGGAHTLLKNLFFKEVLG